MTGLFLELHLQQKSFTLEVDITLPSEGVTVLYGQSGSGKTTLLRCIAGLEKNVRGTIEFKQEQWHTDNKFVPTYKRNIGYVFQEPSLFEHLTTQQNLAFASKRVKGDKQNNEDHIIKLLGIEALLDHYPDQMSGGEKQRVAIARALLSNPSMLLMDEPLASLDTNRKNEILPYLEALKTKLNIPIIYVTHSPDEVARLADHLVVIDDGEIITSGPLSETLSRLESPNHLNAELGVVIDSTISEQDKQWKMSKILMSGEELWFHDDIHKNANEVGSLVRIQILASDVSLSLSARLGTSITNCLPATITEINDNLDTGITLVKLIIGDTAVISRISSRSAHTLNIHIGMKIWAQIKSAAVIR
ncbi:molybdenum ABC transporter ATP-binding protein [Alteromonas sp. 5E99-2]|uniref:molybdenum ABC transporter ATP-binding protein n=1 Tax=Alteromonas sp. 5E99-2 TaxID=2817683 RepID=UPI001A99A464|nr:molybdenum ABC transporter ATP-binding protein [Alteromonas sp. 5E99-2]MBO1254207.1 molybdenum ABC transporter ATP-binding protein [Alteromonas sp. 5E99-2]